MGTGKFCWLCRTIVGCRCFHWVCDVGGFVMSTGSQRSSTPTKSGSDKHRPRCSAHFGKREATVEALSYGWEHWARVAAMANPVGYLYVVGRDRATRR